MKAYYLIGMIGLFGLQGKAGNYSAAPAEVNEPDFLVSTNESLKYPAKFDLRYGLWKADLGQLNRGFTASGYGRISDRINLIGLTFDTGMAYGASSHIGFHLDYNYFLPQNFHPTHSMAGSLSGYAIGAGIGKLIKHMPKHFNLSFNLGFQAGKLKILWTDAAWAQNKSIYSNPFLSGLVMICPRVIFGHFSIGARMGYQYDLSPGIWNHADKSLNAIGNAYMTGYVLEGMIGLRF